MAHGTRRRKEKTRFHMFEVHIRFSRGRWLWRSEANRLNEAGRLRASTAKPQRTGVHSLLCFHVDKTHGQEAFSHSTDQKPWDSAIWL